MAKNAALIIEKGATLRVPVQIRNQDQSPVDITGATIVSQIKSEVGGLVIETFTIRARDDLQGKFELYISAAETDLIAPGTYKYDVKVTYADADVTVVYYLKGSFKIETVITD